MSTQISRQGEALAAAPRLGLVPQFARMDGSAKGEWWPGTESNRRRRPFQGRALPAELPGHLPADPMSQKARRRGVPSPAEPQEVRSQDEPSEKASGTCGTRIIATPTGVPQTWPPRLRIWLRSFRSDGQRFDCTTWMHQAQSLPNDDFKLEIERQLTGKETEPWEIIYFKLYKS